MASSPVVSATLQSACLGVASSLLAQAFTAYNAADGKEVSLAVDWVPVVQYLLYILISTPPNFKWQQLLETSFPAHPEHQPRRPSSLSAKSTTDEATSSSSSSSSSSPPLSKTNTVVKLLLDQTLAAAANTLLYSVFSHSVRAAIFPAPVVASPVDALRFFAGAAYAGRAIDFGRVRWDSVWESSRAEFWPMVVAGMKLWPAVALLNFSLVRSVQGRNLLSGVAGLGWGVYVCLAAAAAS